MGRTVLLLTMVGAMLLALSGVVLAQPSGLGRTAPGDAEQQAAAEKSAGQAVPDRYIVVLKSDADVRKVAEEHSRGRGAEVTSIYDHALHGYAAKIPRSELDDVRTDPRVQFVQPDRTAVAFGQTLPTGVNRIEGDASSTLAGNGSGNVDVSVAVIDTGINKTHPDLNVAGGRNFATFFSPSSNFEDGNGHGTHVAGTIAALDNNDGAVGVAPGAKLYGVKVLSNSGTGYLSWIINGIDWVTGRKAEFNDGQQDGDPGINFAVANMSLGGSGSDSTCVGSDAYHKAICNSVAAGVTYVVAAGNSNADFQNSVPATYGEVLTVTAESDSDGGPGGTGAAPSCRTGEKDDYAATFSNYATLPADQAHTIAAPGVCIYSTWKNGGYNTISGTSMASPHIAGAAALYKANNPTATPAQVMDKLRRDAATRTGIDGSVSGYYGFTGDPNTPNNGGRYYGYLGYVGGY